MNGVLRVGVVVRVKPEVWREWCLRHCEEHKPFTPQPIINCPIRKPYIDYVMLAYPPRYWWRCDEVEVVDQ